MDTKYSYDKDSLKVDIVKAKETIRQKEDISQEAKIQRKEEEQQKMSNMEAAMVIIMLLVMYAVISAIPTFIMMYFFHFSFWLTQLIVLIGTVLVVWIFGLYKPASDEQKAKARFLL